MSEQKCAICGSTLDIVTGRCSLGCVALTKKDEALLDQIKNGAPIEIGDIVYYLQDISGVGSCYGGCYARLAELLWDQVEPRQRGDVFVRILGECRSE